LSISPQWEISHRNDITYDNHVHAEYEVQDEEPAKRTVSPIEQRWIKQIHWVVVQPNRKTNPASDRDGSYKSDTDESPCSSAADSAIVQHKTYEDGADDLENIGHERVERAGADVEIQCYASLNWRCPVDKLQEAREYDDRDFARDHRDKHDKEP
ncbi:MAG: hypothetical protein Q9204_009157, partial [Flavoplaca sp. TL-2023a]